MDPQASKRSYLGTGGAHSAGITGPSMMSWLRSRRSHTRSGTNIATSTTSPNCDCRIVNSPGATISNIVPYSVTIGASRALEELLMKCTDQLPLGVPESIEDVNFKASSKEGDVVLFPCPLKQQEAVGAIKGLEALMASTLVEHRFGRKPGAISVDMMKVACFISSAYITTVNGSTKANSKELKKFLPDTDLNEAQSILYRRLSAGMYETKDGKYYHIHGSLEASTTLEMIGLPSHNETLTDYDKCIEEIEGAVQKFDTSDLEKMNLENKQAGVAVLKREEFLATSHGKAMKVQSPFTVRNLELETKKVPLEDTSPSSRSGRQVIQGIRVLELCRIIAGPTIGRSLAALGADVLKVTCDKLPDVPFFQVDGNTGKHCISLNLKDDKDKFTFEELLKEADVVIDGYRPGSLNNLGYGPKDLTERAKKRGKGYIYVAEDCFGGTDDIGGHDAKWASRRGWQQIADCVTGVAWEQGNFMNGGKEPIIPPFPMSDYGTGALGCVAALVGVYNRATRGGSWICRTSLVQYDLFLLDLGVYSDEVQQSIREKHAGKFFEIRHHDSVDMVSQAALGSINKVYSNPFNDRTLMQTAFSPGFGPLGADIKWPREAVEIEGLDIGHVRVTRPNGFDKNISWEGWERDGGLLKGEDRPQYK